MDEAKKVAYCAPGLEIPARFALIEHARDVDEATADIEQTRFLKPGQVVVVDVEALSARPYAVPPPAPLRPVFVYGLMTHQPLPPVPVLFSGC